MAIDGISASTATTAATGTSKSNTSLSMDDFFTLMVAQLSNQDMYNTVDDTQFISQMAQFSMIQAINDMSKVSLTAYGVSLIGKEATVASTDTSGTLKTTVGIVESVNLYNGSAEVVIDGETYPMSGIMEVREPNIIIPNGETVTQSNTEKTDENG